MMMTEMRMSPFEGPRTVGVFRIKMKRALLIMKKMKIIVMEIENDEDESF